MSPRAFFPTFDQLGATVPLFPLAGVLLLPRGVLPLNVFEPRYIAMVDDALAADRLVGMVQPVDPACRAPEPEVYATACAGRITQLEETEDGRYLITLTGVCRFAIEHEEKTPRGYRRAAASWTAFAGDLDDTPAASLDRQRLARALCPYFKMHGIAANWEAIECTSDERLITSLSMICPFEPREKQALLEAPTLADRGRLMIRMVEMAILGGEGEEGAVRH
jgi:Lon protease-like protein